MSKPSSPSVGREVVGGRSGKDVRHDLSPVGFSTEFLRLMTSIFCVFPRVTSRAHLFRGRVFSSCWRLFRPLPAQVETAQQSIPGLKPLHPLWYALVRIDAGPGFPGRSFGRALVRGWQRLVLPFVLVLIGRGSCNARLISYRWSAAVGTSRGGRQGALRGVSYIPKRNDIVIINSFLIYRASFIVTPSVAVTAKGDGGYPPG